MHNVMDIVQDGKAYRYEHDQNGPVFRTLIDGRVRAIRSDDPGWKDDEGNKGFAENLQTVVERFRARYRGLHDAGRHDLQRPAGARLHQRRRDLLRRPRHRAPARQRDSPRRPTASRSTRETRKPVQGERRPADMRITETVDRFERLPATPENLELLDAPAIDAAQR